MNSFAKSAMACAISVACGVVVTDTVQIACDWWLGHEAFKPTLQTATVFAMTFAGLGLLSFLIGLPVQALLQRFGLTGFLSNIGTAVVFGFPISTWWFDAFWSDVDDPGPASFVAWVKDTLTSLKDWHSIAWFILIYIASGAVVFWLIRRPDRDSSTVTAS